MRRFLILSLLSILFQAGWAQQGRVMGKVLDEQSQPVPFATVVLSSASDSLMLKATTTDMNGVFTLKDFTPQSAYLTISYVGYATYLGPIMAISEEPMAVDPIQLSTSGVDLDAVTITAEKPLIEVLADKTVFNVENSGGTAGLNGIELLRRAPGVILDNNNNVIVEGKSGAQIWIDGKPSVLSGDALNQYLQSLQASDIESIEIITQPSSKYDAEGSAGIINIKLKRDKRYGTNGTVSTGVAYGEYWKNSNSISLNKRTKKLNLFGTYSNNFRKSFNYLNFNQEILDQLYQERSRTIRQDQEHNFKVGTDVYLSSKSTLGLTVTANLGEGDSDNTSTTTILPLAADASSAILRANSVIDWDRTNVLLNGNYRFEDTLGHSLSFDIDFGQYDNGLVNAQPNTYYNADETELLSFSNYQLVTPISIELMAAKMDYEQDVLKGKLGLGVKVSEVFTDNVFDFSREENGELVYQPESSNTFEYTEEVIAAYINYSYRKNKWSTQVGVRAEKTHSLGVLESMQNLDDARVERDYLNFFPSAGLTYQYNETDSWVLNYSRRIRRPDYEELNPFEQRLNELGFRKGNPFLNPNYADNLKLSHTYKYRYTTSLSYSYVNDFYAQVTDTLSVGDSNVNGFVPSFIQARNVADEQTLSLSISAPFDVNKWWSVYLNLTGSNTSYTSTDSRFNPITQATFNAYAQNTFTLPKEWEFQISGWYSTPSVWGGTFKTLSLGSLDMALQKKFWKKKLSVSLSASDIFYTSFWRAQGEFNNLPLDGDGGWESRQVRLNLKYNFGNPDLRSRKERKAAAEDELNRISQ